MVIKRVKLYNGVVQKSGKAVFSFSGVKLVHRSIAKDKSDYIIHQETEAVILAMPIGSDRSRALDYLAKHIDRLLEFNTKHQSYELYKEEHLPRMTKQERIEANRVPYEPIYKEPSYSNGSFDGNQKKKTTYDMRFIKW